MTEAQTKTKSPKRADRAILATVAAGVVTLVAAAWFAFTVEAPTTIEATQEGGLLVTGPEADLVGTLRSAEGSRTLEIRGLPGVETIRKNPAARRAICLARDNPATVWEEPSASLRALLASEQYEALCEVYRMT